MLCLLLAWRFLAGASCKGAHCPYCNTVFCPVRCSVLNLRRRTIGPHAYLGNIIRNGIITEVSTTMSYKDPPTRRVVFHYESFLFHRDWTMADYFRYSLIHRTGEWLCSFLCLYVDGQQAKLSRLWRQPATTE